jgi:hypothetical protein
MQLTISAVTLRVAGSPSNRTRIPISSGRPNFTPHPWGLTRTTKHGSTKGQKESRVVKVSRMLQGILVPHRKLTIGRVLEMRKRKDKGSNHAEIFLVSPLDSFGFQIAGGLLDSAETLALCKNETAQFWGRVFSFELPRQPGFIPFGVIRTAHEGSIHL